jgi:hypothetical protein
VLLFGIVLAGCDNPKPIGPYPVVSPPAPPVPPVPPTAPVTPVTSPDAEAPALTPTETVKADVGVGQKGRGLDPHEGIYVTPAKAYFAAKERIIFQIQIPEALKLYKALEGSAPKTHEEFMEQIIQANQIKLPELPPGAKYVYKPETEELMVERPQPANP